MILHCKNKYGLDAESSEKNAGFTLAEMLVVLMTIALMTTLSFPYLAGKGQLSKEQKIAEKLFGLFKVVRQHALVTNQKTTVSFDQSSRRFTSSLGPQNLLVPAHVSVKMVATKDKGEAHLVQFGFYADGTSSGGGVEIGKLDKIFFIKIDWLTGVVSKGAGPLKNE